MNKEELMAYFASGVAWSILGYILGLMSGILIMVYVHKKDD